MVEELKIADLRTFSSIADTLNFTRSAETLGATQSAVSLRIQRLETLLGRKILARTPRGVSLTAEGSDFLIEARRLLAQHDAIIRRSAEQTSATELKIGISNHFAGGRLPSVLAHLARAVPDLRLEVEVAESVLLNAGFEDGTFDAVILREIHDDKGPKGYATGQIRRLEREKLRWYAPRDFDWSQGDPLPLVTLTPRCHIRDASQKALDRAGIPWREVFTGGGIGVMRAAVTAGLGVTCLSSHNRPDLARDVTDEFSLPLPPSSDYVLLLRSGTLLTKPQMSAMVAAFKGKPA